MVTPSSSARLQVKLSEQLDFLMRSAQLYDRGHEDEALRLATAMRILFHQTPKSKALMVQLGLDGSNMLSSSRGLGGWKDYLQHRIELNSARPIVMLPVLENNLHEIPFGAWWDGEAVFEHLGVAYTRKKIVCSMANKDGGTHVDELEKYYNVLCSGEWAIGITGNLKHSGDAPFPQGITIYPNNAHFALIRQFSFEVMSSATHFGWNGS
jgi:hypothetical protein